MSSVHHHLPQSPLNRNNSESSLLLIQYLSSTNINFQTSPTIFITGVTGYISGEVAVVLAQKHPEYNLVFVVRNEEQAKIVRARFRYHYLIRHVSRARRYRRLCHRCRAEFGVPTATVSPVAIYGNRLRSYQDPQSPDPLPS